MGCSRLVAVSFAMLSLTACRSAYVQTTVSNHTAEPLSLIEVDYPSASFGTQGLAPGADFHYRFKVLGSGAMKIIYTDSKRKEHTVTGPSLAEGTQGPLSIVITPGGVQWVPAFRR